MLSLEQSGNGRPLVLIHGFCEDNTCFNEQVLLLNTQFNVIRPNLPGIGNSPFVSDLTIEHSADLLHRTLQHLGIHQCVMIGHSMGGYVTLAFAKKFPEMLKGFGLMHSTANPDNDDRKAKRDQAIRMIGEFGNAKYVEQFIPPLFKESKLHEPRIAALIQQAKLITPVSLQAQLMSMKNRHSGIDWLKETTLPALFIAGELDQIIPVKDMIAQAATVKSGQIALLKNAAHMGMIEEEQITADILTSFANLVFA